MLSSHAQLHITQNLLNIAKIKLRSHNKINAEEMNWLRVFIKIIDLKN